MRIVEQFWETYGDPKQRRAILVLIGCTIGMAVNFVPMFVATFALFVKPFAEDFHWSRTAVTIGYSVATICLALTSSLAGALADRFSPRKVLIFGVPLFGLSFATILFVNGNYPLFLFVFILLGALAAGSFNVMYVLMLGQWFNRRYGLALGICAAGGGLGLTLSPSYAQMLIDGFGWQAAYVGLGLTSIAVAWPIAWLFPRSSTSPERGTAEPSNDANELKLHRRTVVASPTFRRLMFCYILMAANAGAYVVSFVPLLTDRGYGAEIAAAIIGLYGISAFVSRLSAGYLLDKVDAGRLGASIFFLAVPGGALLLFPGSPFQMAAGIMLIGLSAGAEAEVAVYIVRKLYGTRSLGTFSGIVYSCMLIGTVIGPLLFSMSYDQLGSYQSMQYIILLGCLTAAILHYNVTRSSNMTLSLKPS